MFPLIRRGQREIVYLEVVEKVGYVEVPGGWLGAKCCVELLSVENYVAESVCERWSRKLFLTVGLPVSFRYWLKERHLFTLPRHNVCWNWVNVFGIEVEFF